MSPVFDAYAAYYDLLYRDKDYAAEAGYVAGLLRSRAPGAVRILELGCGTGAHAEHLARMGYEVTGIDMSRAMLERAGQRRDSLPAEISARLSFLQGDVRSFRLGQCFDAVISLFHVFSYQASNQALDDAFATASAHLEEGGTLLFDYWYGPAVLTQRPEVRVRRIENEVARVQRIAEPELDAAANCVTVNYSVAVEERASGFRHTFSEAHVMRYLFIPEIERVAGSGFARVEHRAWMKDCSPSPADWAAVTVMERVA